MPVRDDIGTRFPSASQIASAQAAEKLVTLRQAVEAVSAKEVKGTRQAVMRSPFWIARLYIGRALLTAGFLICPDDYCRAWFKAARSTQIRER
jgi:hypothetical protein